MASALRIAVADNTPNTELIAMLITVMDDEFDQRHAALATTLLRYSLHHHKATERIDYSV